MMQLHGKQLLNFSTPRTSVEVASARLVKGGAAVEMRKGEAGYEITLPPGMEWDAVNTVIAVQRR